MRAMPCCSARRSSSVSKSRGERFELVQELVLEASADRRYVFSACVLTIEAFEISLVRDRGQFTRAAVGTPPGEGGVL